MLKVFIESPLDSGTWEPLYVSCGDKESFKFVDNLFRTLLEENDYLACLWHLGWIFTSETLTKIDFTVYGVEAVHVETKDWFEPDGWISLLKTKFNVCIVGRGEVK